MRVRELVTLDDRVRYSPACCESFRILLREITTDIIYPVSRAEKGSFQSGVQQEFRWRSDSSRHWLPRESRLLCEIEFAFGETALTGTGNGDNEFMAMGKAAPKNRTDGTGVKPNANVALTAAPLHSLFDSIPPSIGIGRGDGRIDRAVLFVADRRDRYERSAEA